MMWEVLAQAASQPPAPVAGDQNIAWYIVSAAGAGLVGVGGAVLRLGVTAGNFLAPLIQKVTDAHVSFLHKIENSSEQQVEATKTLAACVDSLRSENSTKLEMLIDVHKKICDAKQP